MSELGEVIYQSIFTARVPKSPLAAAMPDLSEDLLSELEAATSEVAAELGDHIRCQAGSKLNVAQVRGQLRGDGGARQVPSEPKVGYTHVFGGPGIRGVNILAR